MRIFVAGATGVLGSELLPALVSAGHTVFGLARTPAKLLQVEQRGAKSVRGDVLDAPVLRRLVQEIQPDVVVNLATSIPLRLKVNPKDWEGNDRVRVEGTANLLAAAQETSLQLWVQGSVGYVCASQGERWMDEEAPLNSNDFVAGTRQMEELVRSSRLPTTLLRWSALISAHSWHTQQSIAALKRGLLPIIGDGKAYLSQIHAEDAAAAILCTLRNPVSAAGKVYFVTDNEPGTMADVQTYAAQTLHAPAPRRVPPFMAKMIVGAATIELFTASYRLSNARIRQELGFAPKYPSYREAWTQIAQAVSGKEFAPSEDLK